MPSTTGVRHSVVCVSSRARDHVRLREIFRNSQWQVHGVLTSSDGLRLLRRNCRNVFVVICENNLPDGDWKSLLAEMDQLPLRPVLIVASRLADDRLWAEVLNLGAFDLLLAEPFEPEEVLRVTESAWREANRSVRSGAVPRLGPVPARNLGGDGVRALAVSGVA